MASQDLYYGDVVFHTDFPGVQERINRIISGDAGCNWMEYLAGRFGTLGRLLSLNCGNGWVERALHQRGLISAVLGVDISEPLLEQARAAAAAAGMAADYQQMDSNAAAPPAGAFDSVLNHAALHHVTWLDRLLRSLCNSMPAEGLLICYDYVGPHRNQYPWEVWSRVLDLWGEIPEADRSPLVYPHYRTMLHLDPSEAVHAELVLEVIGRYFEVVEERGLDGAIAYPLLYENRRFLAAVREGRHLDLLERVLEADAAWSAQDPARSFFAFQVCRPRKAVLADAVQLARWTGEEEARESAAMAAQGRYGPILPLEHLYNEVGELRDALRHRPETPAAPTTPAWRRLVVRLLGRQLINCLRKLRSAAP